MNDLKLQEIGKKTHQMVTELKARSDADERRGNRAGMTHLELEEVIKETELAVARFVEHSDLRRAGRPARELSGQ